MSNENDTNKVHFIVFRNGKQIADRNFWAFDETVIDGVQYRYANEFTIITTNSVKYVCFVPYNINPNATTKAATNITRVSLDSEIMITYHDKEIEMKEGFIYRFNGDLNTFDEIPVPKDIKFKSYNKDNAKITFKDYCDNVLFDESMYSTFANGDKFIFNEFYWAFDGNSNLGIFQKFILRTTYNTHRYILLKKYITVGNYKDLSIRCSMGERFNGNYIEKFIKPSRVINAYPTQIKDQHGIAFNLIDPQNPEYVITDLGLEIFNVARED